MNNVVFYFSGTGNCLKVAKTIANELGNTEIISMANNNKFAVSNQYDSIGFVYPTYALGLPKKVIEFVDNLSITNNGNTYYYAIATCGGNTGNALYQLYELLFKNHNIKLKYGKRLPMVANNVALYNMTKNPDKVLKRSNIKLCSIITSIKNRKNKKIWKITKIMSIPNQKFREVVSTMDNNFIVNDNCTGCGICKEVCPVKNIEMENNKPKYKHNCEMCVACIQFCPKRAIDYKNKTQKRRRYTHPEIDYKEFIKMNKVN